MTPSNQNGDSTSDENSEYGDPKISDILHDEEYKNHFRVSIFGSARIKPEDQHYKDIFNLAEHLGRYGFDVVTGGGPGIMEAANAGHQSGRTDDSTHSIGLTIRLPWENKPNKYLNISQHFNHFSGRLDEFMMLSNAVIVTNGGIGTCLEFFYTWQLSQVQHICPIPIIFVGHQWTGLLKWLKDVPLANGLISEKDFKNVYHVKDIDEAVELVIDAKQLYDKEGNEACLNIEKYRVA